MKELKKLLLKPKVKACWLGILTILNSIFCNYAVGSNIFWKWAVLFFTAGIYVFSLIKYTDAENDSIEELERVKGEVEDMELSLKSYSTSLQGVTEICKFCAKKANVQIHEIIENSRLDCKTWNFDVACDSVCKAIYQYIIENLNLQETDGGIVDIEIAYVKIVEAERKQESNTDRISLSGYYHPTRNGPKIQGKKRPVEENGYHDAQLFFKNMDSLDIQMNSSEIKSVFKNQDNKDYTQYLGVPVFCSTSENTSKMVGLLEIVCHGDSVLSQDRKVIETMANHIFAPYAYLFLLLFKMDKALRAVPVEGSK